MIKREHFDLQTASLVVVQRDRRMVSTVKSVQTSSSKSWTTYPLLAVQFPDHQTGIIRAYFLVDIVYVSQ